jgi:hypothetical protein
MRGKRVIRLRGTANSAIPKRGNKEERTRILELYLRGTITMEGVDKQLEAIESEEKALFQLL